MRPARHARCSHRSVELAAGDGRSSETPGEIRIKGLEDAEFLLFDLG